MIGNIYKLGKGLEIVVVHQHKESAICVPLFRDVEPSIPEELKVLQGTVAVWYKMSLLNTTLSKLQCVDELNDADTFSTALLYVISLRGIDSALVPPTMQVGPKDGVHVDAQVYRKKYEAALAKVYYTSKSKLAK